MLPRFAGNKNAPRDPYESDDEKSDPDLRFLRHFGVVGGAWAQTATLVSEEKAVFAGGCFWCMQPPFDHVSGVTATRVGFAGGREANPTDRQVSSGETTHREAIEVTFDSTKIFFAKLLEVFWQNINPIQVDGQFHDIGDQYTSALFYGTEEQKKAAEESKEALAKSGNFRNLSRQ